MTKGQRVYITGRVSYGEIKDQQGSSHVTTSIIAEDVIFITDSAARNRGADRDEAVKMGQLILNYMLKDL